MNKPSQGPRDAPGLRLDTVWIVIGALLLGLLAVDLLPHCGIFFASSRDLPTIDQLGKSLGDFSRVLGVTLSMLTVLCVLAVPLTANVYTPKLIEIFAKDRKNRLVLAYYVGANLLVVYTKYVVAIARPADAHLRVAACLVLTLVGILAIGPFILHVLRFLVPTHIVERLRDEILVDLRSVDRAQSLEQLQEALDLSIRNVQYLGKIVLRSAERHDRHSAYAGLDALRVVFDSYQERKAELSARFEALERCVTLQGLGPELLQDVQRKHATLEVAILQELGLILPVAMVNLPGLVARLAALTSHFGAVAAQRKDDGVLEMSILHFNTFLRQALKAREPDSFYKFVYHYRLLCEDLLDSNPAGSLRVAFFLDYYGHQAVRMGLGYFINVVAYDLAELVDLAYRKASPVRRELLDTMAQLDRDAASLLEMPGIIKAQIILTAKLRTRQEAEAAQVLEAELRKVPEPRLLEAFTQVMQATQRDWWEIADRRRHLDYVEEEFRPAIAGLRRDLTGPREKGIVTQTFLRVVEDLDDDDDRGSDRSAAAPAAGHRAPSDSAPSEDAPSSAPSDSTRGPCPAAASKDASKDAASPTPPAARARPAGSCSHAPRPRRAKPEGSS